VALSSFGHRAAPAAAGALPGTRFVDPATLARIDNLELVARAVVTGFINGLHRSPYLGFSLDFAEHRPYMPGDDIRRIDWRLYARTDRFYVKLFEAETNANFVAAMDVSRSMDYGSGEISKLDYARFLAATLAYFSRQQKDRVGLALFDRDLTAYVPPSAKHLEIVLQTIERETRTRERSSRVKRDPTENTDGKGEGGLRRSLFKVTEALRRRGVVVVISDFYEPADDAIDALARLKYAGHDVIAFHLLDPTEIDFPFQQASSFEDLESGERMPIIDYQVVNTGEPLDQVLFNYLSLRYRLSRTR
jgi:uncharacterized protein (DUF58 family)